MAMRKFKIASAACFNNRIFQFSVFDVLTSQGLADLRGAISPRAGQILEKIKDLHMRNTSICKATHPELISLTTSFSGF